MTTTPTQATLPAKKTHNPNNTTQAYLATEHYNEGWNDCIDALVAANASKALAASEARDVGELTDEQILLIGRQHFKEGHATTPTTLSAYCDSVRSIIITYGLATRAREAAPNDMADRDRYRGCREYAVERGLFPTPEEYDAMVDDSLNKRKKGNEPLTGRGNNYGKKVARDGSMRRVEAAPVAVGEAKPARADFDVLVDKFGLWAKQRETFWAWHVANVAALASQAAPVTQDAQRLETTSEHIARDMKEGRFPERSEPQMVSDTEQASEPAAWRNHPGALDTKSLATAQEIALMWGRDRSQFVSRIQVAVREAMDWIRAAQPTNAAKATAAHAGASDEADMFWTADDGDQMFHSLDDAIIEAFNNDCGEVGAELEFTCAARLPNVKVRITGVSEDGWAWEEVAAPTPNAAKGESE